MITPNKFLSAPYGIALRQFLVNSHSLKLLYDVSKFNVFEEASIYPVISVIQKSKDKEEKTFDVEIGHPEKNIHYIHERYVLASLPDTIWGFILSDGIKTVLKILEYSTQLSKKSEVVASTTAAEADNYSKALLNSSTIDQNMMKINNTGLIDRYDSLWGQIELAHQGQKYRYPLLNLNSDLVPERRIQQYKSPKLIFAKVALIIEALYDDEGNYASMNTNFVIASDRTLGYLASLCNSRFISWIYSEYFSALSMSGGYMQFQAPQIGVIPIRNISFTTPEPAKKELVNNGEALYEEYIMTGNVAILDFVEDCLPKDPEGNFIFDKEKSDVIHDVLAFLADRMNDLNKEKQSHIKDFLGWLEDYLGTDIDNLKLKTKLAGYYLNEWKDFFDAIKKNKDSIEKNVDDMGFHKSLKDNYEHSLASINPLLERIQKTDDLIDQIVYKLYGLTEEEIGVVEGE